MNPLIYETPYEIKGLSWSNRSDQMFRLAVLAADGAHDEVHLIQFHPDQGSRVDFHNAFDNERACANAVAFFPRTDCYYSDVLACATDVLSLWTITDRYPELRCELSINTRRRRVTLTAIEWNAEAPQRIATLCSRGSCTIWDVQREVSETQLFTRRHSRFVNDVSWGGPDLFAACFQDGNVKVYDLRTRQKVTIYASRYGVDKVEWNPINRYNIALAKGSTVLLYDLRWGVVGSSSEHWNDVTSIAWDPMNRRRLCTAGRDSQAVMWELPSPQRPYETVRSCFAGGPIQQLKWSTLQPTWAAIGFNDQLEIMEVVLADGSVAF